MAVDRPNIVFFLTDDQRFDTIRAWGNEAIHTPNMDRLVRAGVSFTRAHIPCGTSGAVCMPSRAMLHSGRSLFHLEGAGQRIPPQHETLAETLRRNGYQTFGSGKWHNGTAAFHRGFADGDEIFFGGMADHWNVPAYHYDPSGRYDTVCAWIENWQTDNTVRRRRCDHIHAGRHSSEIIAEAGLRFLREASRAQPFFLYLSFLAPHDPRSMPEEFLNLYNPDDMVLPPNVLGGHPFDTGALHIRDEMLAGFPRQPAEIRRHIAEYYAMISHLDAQIGRVLDDLDRRGLTESTLLVFAGDNGLALGQHGLMGKQNCYEHSVRVPLIFAGPGLPRDVRSDAYAYLFDVFPTLCDLLGIDIPASVEGISLAPVCRCPERGGQRSSLYFAYTDTQRAVKNERYKLIEYVIDGRHTMTQLFDLVADPWERENLAFTGEYAGVVAEMRRLLEECRDEWDDPDSEWGRRFWQGMEHVG